MPIVEIKENDTVLARHIPAGDAWGEGLSFFSPAGDFLQVGTWSYPRGKHLLPHEHVTAVREIHWTQEVLYIRRGRIRAVIFDSNRARVADFEASSGDILVMLAGGHGYDIVEEGTQVLEVKNGPYLGADADRVRLNEVESALPEGTSR